MNRNPVRITHFCIVIHIIIIKKEVKDGRSSSEKDELRKSLHHVLVVEQSRGLCTGIQGRRLKSNSSFLLFSFPNLKPVLQPCNFLACFPFGLLFFYFFFYVWVLVRSSVKYIFYVRKLYHPEKRITDKSNLNAKVSGGLGWLPFSFFLVFFLPYSLLFLLENERKHEKQENVTSSLKYVKICSPPLALCSSCSFGSLSTLCFVYGFVCKVRNFPFNFDLCNVFYDNKFNGTYK